MYFATYFGGIVSAAATVSDLSYASMEITWMPLLQGNFLKKKY